MTDRKNTEYDDTQQAILFMCRMTFQSLTVVLVVAYVLIYLLVAVKPANAATLKPEAVINGSTVKASDLFDDVPTKQDAIVGNAPSPGQSVILNAKALERIANIYNIKWSPASQADQIIVRSTIQTISTAEITTVIQNDLVNRGVKGNFIVSLNNVAPTLSLPGDVPATAEVAQMTYTPGRDVFSAVVAAPSANNPLKTVTVSGLIEKTVQVPVLNSAMKEDDIISSSDIQWVDVAARNLVNDTIVDADKLIGKTPIRMVDAGVPVRGRDIKAPQLVARGDDILIQFNQGGLQLTAKGRAMQNGAEGEIIRVLNVSSNQSIRGEVTGSKIVVVQ